MYAEFLPGKRALAIALCVYHATVSTVLFNAPRFIPHTFEPLAESYVVPLLAPVVLPPRCFLCCPADGCVQRFRATPENVWGVLHGVLGLSFAVWWQVTVHMASMVKKMA